MLSNELLDLHNLVTINHNDTLGMLVTLFRKSQLKAHFFTVSGCFKIQKTLSIFVGSI